MSEQLGLGLTRRAPRLPAAHADASTSHVAARDLHRSGQLSASCRRTLDALATWRDVPPTSAELAAGDIAARFEHARRLADLLRLGLVDKAMPRPCGVSGKMASTWVLTAAGRAARQGGGA